MGTGLNDTDLGGGNAGDQPAGSWVDPNTGNLWTKGPDGQWRDTGGPPPIQVPLRERTVADVLPKGRFGAPIITGGLGPLTASINSPEGGRAAASLLGIEPGKYDAVAYLQALGIGTPSYYANLLGLDEAGAGSGSGLGWAQLDYQKSQDRIQNAMNAIQLLGTAAAREDARRKAAQDAVLESAPYITNSDYFTGMGPGDPAVRAGLVSPARVTRIPFDPNAVLKPTDYDQQISDALGRILSMAGA